MKLCDKEVLSVLDVLISARAPCSVTWIFLQKITFLSAQHFSKHFFVAFSKKDSQLAKIPIFKSSLHIRRLLSPLNMRIGISSVQVSSACSTSFRVPTTTCAHGNTCAGTRWFPAKGLTAAHRSSQGTRSRRSMATLAGIKAVETYDGKFDLTKESEGTLKALLTSEVFCKQAGAFVLHSLSLFTRELCSLTS